MPAPVPRRWDVLVRLGLLFSALLALNLLARHVLPLLHLPGLDPGIDHAPGRLLVIAGLVYALVLAVPFVPGVEIGLALIAMFGPPVVPLVYACTLAGLGIAYAAGSMIPLTVLLHAAQRLGLRRTEASLEAGASHDSTVILANLTRAAPGRLVPWLVRNRHVALALAINLPGNTLIGGGGGIALMAGLSRLYSPPAFLLTVAIAVLPVPLLVLILDWSWPRL